MDATGSSKPRSRRGVSWGRRRRAVGAAIAGGVSALAFLPAAGALAAPKAPAAPGSLVPVIVEYGSSSSDAAKLVDSIAPADQQGPVDHGKGHDPQATGTGGNDSTGSDAAPGGAAADSPSGGQAADAPGKSKDKGPQLKFHAVPAVAVSLTPGAIASLEAHGAVVTPDATVSVQSTTSPSATCPGPTSPSTPTGLFPTDTGSAQLAAATGDQGQGVTVAVLDTGINASLPDFGNRVIGGVDLTGGNSPFTDEYGHGTFVSGLIAGNGASSKGKYVGEAPQADLVAIKAADATGATDVATVIQGIDWAIANQSAYGIKVLNLSLGMLPTGPAATEPMDQAVEAAWNAGITVVVSAGNAGPFNGTILSPGDDPLAITVGAYADNDSTAPADWAACAFSSVGPTAFDGYLKPDVLAPGRSVVSLADPGSTIYLANPLATVGKANFVGSGTSFSAAITSGAAALVLSAHPSAAPNEVKGRLLGDAMPAPLGNPLVEGHGLLNALYATTGPAMVLNQTGPRSPGGPHASSTGYSTVPLGSSWNGSSWNANNWTGSSWNGSSWNGSSWNGSSWNGSSWNGSSWNGSSWNGSSWNGSSWNGSSWNGSSWNGSSWNGSSWNGMVWNGSSWNGSSWNGSSWNGSSWNGSSWNGSSWNGSSWNGSSWNGSSWNGSSWNGSSWN